MNGFIEISTDNIIKETNTNCGKKYIVYIDLDNTYYRNYNIRVNTWYTLNGNKALLNTDYDRGLCETKEEYNRLSIEYIESQAYGSYMDGARGER